MKRFAFALALLAALPFAASAAEFNQVQTDKSAIGYVSLDFISGTSPAGYNGVTCNLRNAKSGEYGGVRNFWLVTRGAATGQAASFIKWTQQNSKARTIISKHWVPLS